VTAAALEVAPGVAMDAMAFNGTVVGPVLRSELGARLTVDLVNNGAMGHSRICPRDGSPPVRSCAPTLPGGALRTPAAPNTAGGGPAGRWTWSTTAPWATPGSARGTDRPR